MLLLESRRLVSDELCQRSLQKGQAGRCRCDASGLGGGKICHAEDRKEREDSRSGYPFRQVLEVSLRLAPHRSRIFAFAVIVDPV